jgi:hypothetical protein
LLNARLDLLQRLRTRLLTLSISAGLLLAFAVTLIVVAMRSISFFFNSSSPLDQALLKILPVAMTIGLIVAGIAAARAAASLRNAGAIPAQLLRITGAGFAVLICAWILGVVPDLFHATLLSPPVFGLACWIGGGSASIGWSESQRRAVWAVARSTHRAFAILQLTAACLLAVIGAILTAGPLMGVPFHHGVAYVYYYSQNSLIYVLFALLLLIGINALLLRLAIDHVVKARNDGA